MCCGIQLMPTSALIIVRGCETIDNTCECECADVSVPSPECEYAGVHVLSAGPSSGGI
jgi:hypothetical protein